MPPWGARPGALSGGSPYPSELFGDFDNNSTLYFDIYVINGEIIQGNDVFITKYA